MANFTCIRARKRKGATIKAMAEHNFRDGPREVKNADSSRTALNVQLVPATTSAEALETVKTRLEGCKRRKDSVEVIEYMVMASPEQFLEGGRLTADGGRAYFETVYRWLEEQHGAANVAWATIQYDETSPHLSVGVVARVDDPDGPKLAASRWLNGRKALSAMQDRVAAIGAQHGLQRGVKGSPAKHETVRRFYGAMNMVQDDPRLQPMMQRKLELLPPEPGVADKLTGRAAAMEEARAKAIAKRKRDEEYNRQAIAHNRERMKLLTQLAGRGLEQRESQNERARLAAEAKQQAERAEASAQALQGIAAIARQRKDGMERLEGELAKQKERTIEVGALASAVIKELREAAPERARAVAERLGLVKPPEPTPEPPQERTRDNGPGMSGP